MEKVLKFKDSEVHVDFGIATMTEFADLLGVSLQDIGNAYLTCSNKQKLELYCLAIQNGERKQGRKVEISFLDVADYIDVRPEFIIEIVNILRGELPQPEDKPPVKGAFGNAKSSSPKKSGAGKSTSR